MGKEDALRGGVYWLVEPLYGKRLHRLVQSTHHQGAQALAITHRLSLAALVTPVAWSVATMKTAVEGRTLFRFSPAPVNNPIAITATLHSVAVMAIGQCGSWRSAPVG